MKGIRIWWIIFSICFFLISCGKKENKVRVLKLAHALDVTHPVHLGMVYMAEKVREYSKGKIRIDIYPAAQLGDEKELIELLQIGTLAMTKVSAAPLEAFVPQMRIFGLPYLFSDDNHRWEILDGWIGESLLVAGEKYFLRGLCYYDAGSRSFYTINKPIYSPADLKGMKIRVMKSITSISMIKALGGSPTPIPWGELYTSLQQGVVDGAENNPPTFYLSKHYEVCKFFTLDEHVSIPDILLISTVVWERLSKEEKTWLKKAATESSLYQRKLWEKATIDALEAVEKAGVKIIKPNKELFEKAVASIYEAYRGTSLDTLINEIKRK